MRISRPRFTVRRLMVAVAIVGAVLGFREWIARRSARFLRIAELHGMPTLLGLGDLTTLTNRESGGPRPRTFPDHAALIFEYDMLMAEKYGFAARYPWLPVAPDPPVPK